MPARLRIVAWIVLTAGLGLLTVVLTVRSALLTDVEESANSAVVQEIDEFRTFAERGLDPATGAPFGAADRLLGLYLERQFPDGREVLLGWDSAAAAQGRPALLVQAAGDPVGLRAEPNVVRGLVEGADRSGIVGVGDDEVRWGKAEVLPRAGAGGGTFLVAVALGPGRDEVADVMELVLLVSLGGLVLVAGIAFAVAGQILQPVRAAGRAIGAVARSGLDRRVEVRGRDDVASLALAVNALLDRLQVAAATRNAATAAATHRVRAALDDPGQDSAVRDAAVALNDLDLLCTSQDPARRRIRSVDLADLDDELVAEIRNRGSRWVLEGRLRGTAVLDPDLVRAAFTRLCAHVESRDPQAGPLRAIRRTVQDEGGGTQIELEVLDRLAPPETADAEEAFTPDGDLGLAAVAAVAEAHDGSVWVEPRPEGTGFGFSLPAEGPDNDPESPAPDDRPEPLTRPGRSGPS